MVGGKNKDMATSEYCLVGDEFGIDESNAPAMQMQPAMSQSRPDFGDNNSGSWAGSTGVGGNTGGFVPPAPVPVSSSGNPPAPTWMDAGNDKGEGGVLGI